MRAALMCLLAAALAAPPGRAADKAAPADSRQELARLRSTLEAAVRRVSRSAAPPTTAPQVYRLKGYGTILVLSPRILPLRRTAEDHEARAVAQAVRGLQDSLPRVRSAEVRQQILASLHALRQTEARRVAAGDRVVVRRELTPAEAEALGFSGQDLQRLERDLHDGLAAQAQALREAEDQMRGLGIRQEAELTEQFVLMQDQAEAFRRDVERMRAQAEREVWGRLQPPVAPVAGPAPGPPQPRPPLPPVPARSPVVSIPAVPPAPHAPEPPEAPLPPPWRFWIETEEEPDADAPTADALLRQVREAVVAGLEAHRGTLSLPAEEFVVAAVDFVSRAPAARRPAGRTLMVRVRAGDLAERRAGRLTAADFRKRVAFEVD